ncbi:MAG: DoxX family protein [Acetobacteraceae bacterium]
MPNTTRLAAAWEPRILSILRIIVGLMFMEHGLGKLIGFPPVPSQPAAFHLLWFAGIIETVGGFLVAIGLFTRAAAFIVSGEMTIAYFMAHAPRGLYPVLNGGDAAILYSLIFFYFFVAGGGAWSLDRLRLPRAAGRSATG